MFLLAEISVRNTLGTVINLNYLIVLTLKMMFPEDSQNPVMQYDTYIFPPSEMVIVQHTLLREA